MTNPIILGIVAGLLWSALGLKMPHIMQKTVTNIGGVATPMGLMAMGATFDIKKAFAKVKPAAVATFMKLIGLAAIFLPIAITLGFRREELVAILVMLGSATTGKLFCYGEKYGRRSCFVIVDHCAQHGAECGYADIDAVHSAFDGAYLT